MFSTDGSGNVYGCIYCESCNKFIEKCPCCKDCNSIIVVDEYGCKNHLEFFGKLKKVVGQGDDIFECIYFEKKVGSQKLYDTEKGSVFKPIYKFVETPKVYSLEELVGTGEI